MEVQGRRLLHEWRTTSSKCNRRTICKKILWLGKSLILEGEQISGSFGENLKIVTENKTKEALKYFLQENTGVYSKDIQLCAQVGHAVNTLYMVFFSIYVYLLILLSKEKKRAILVSQERICFLKNNIHKNTYCRGFSLIDSDLQIYLIY